VCRVVRFAAALLLASAGPVAAQRADVAAAMARGLREEGLVGAVWSTVGAGGVVSVGAAGARQAGRPEPLTPDDRVQVGSVTKTLVATGILRLVTEGRLRLDTPVAALLPRIPIENPWAATHPLLLRHLLDHTSGLDDARLWQLFNAEPGPDTPLAAGVDPGRVRLVARQPPGARFSYSNTGYTLLGLVIEALTGERYETYLDTHLLHPLGMSASTFGFVTQVGPGADPRLAMGHFEEGALAPAVPGYLRPAMQFTTTAGDMARFARFLMSDGTIEGRPFIDRDLLAAMGTPSGTEAARAGLGVGYGLGLGGRDRHGAIGRCHAGNTVGYRAMFCIFREQGRAFFVAMNADNEDANYARLDSLVIASLDLERTAPTVPRDAGVDVTRWEGVYVAAPARFEAFAYLDVVLGFVRVRAEDGRLTLTPFQGRTTPLEPLGGAAFRAPGRTIASHVLLTTRDGGRAYSDGTHTYERASLRRMVPLWASLVAGVLGLCYILVVGTYRVLRRRRTGDPLRAPLVATVVTVVAGALFARQSVLALGDATAVNMLLAIGTGALPIAALAGLWYWKRLRPTGHAPVRDAAALVALLQWALVLAAWGLLPLRLWA
jgi:CubicO group peptidase (beta-lactamase class C family)